MTRSSRKSTPPCSSWWTKGTPLTLPSPAATGPTQQRGTKRRCRGLEHGSSSQRTSRSSSPERGIDRTEFLVLHNQQDVVEECQFVNNGRGYDLGYSPGLTVL